MTTTPRGRVVRTLRTHIRSTPVVGPLARLGMHAYRWLRNTPPTPEQQKVFEYDRMTVEVARRCLTGKGVCIDIGANQGNLLREFIRVSPSSRFVAFEPIPVLARRLQRQWPGAVVHHMAVSDETGTTTLRYLPDRPAVSSLHVRASFERGQRVEQLQVAVDLLDNVVEQRPVEFVKIDVEGAELQVLRGSPNILQRDRPILVIECGGSTNLRAVERYLADVGYRMWSMPAWLAGTSPVSHVDDLLQLHADGEYQFVAGPQM